MILCRAGLLFFTTIVPVVSTFALDLPNLPILLTPGQPNPTASWSPSTNAGVVGYRLYRGTQTRMYSSMVDAGNVLQLAVPNLTNGVTYFFAVTAYTTNGVESDFSAEISYTPGSGSTNPPADATLTLAMNPQNIPILTGDGMAGHNYQVEGTVDFATWTDLRIVTADSAGHFSYTDTGAGSFPARFYRVKDLNAAEAGMTLLSTVGSFPYPDLDSDSDCGFGLPSGHKWIIFYSTANGSFRIGTDGFQRL